MKLTTLMTRVFLTTAVAAATLLPALASQKNFKADRVTVESGKSFADVSGAVKKMVAGNGMMVMAEVDQGKMLSMTGLKLEAKLFLIGNPNVGKKLFQRNKGVGLYVPLRIFVYSDGHGKTFISYDKPSSLLAQFGDSEIKKVGGMLDQKLDGLANMAAK